MLPSDPQVCRIGAESGDQLGCHLQSGSQSLLDDRCRASVRGCFHRAATKRTSGSVLSLGLCESLRMLCASRTPEDGELGIQFIMLARAPWQELEQLMKQRERNTGAHFTFSSMFLGPSVHLTVLPTVRAGLPVSVNLI